ncbi:MAG: carboxypeptidase regulatory-like domain-containing protein [bacterium]|nr:carboxypeptidase regulatory-like domain-containing protein [bacterium]
MQTKTNTATSYKLQATSSSRRASRGVTLIDTVVGTSLMLVVFLGIFAAFQLSVDVVLNNKARAGATALANERMEYIRSLTYSQVGTIGGIPAGIIPQTETITLNGIPYTRRTFIQYADDSGDGLGAADTNSITADYKALRSDVYWTARTGERHITVLSRMSPGGSGIEAAVPGGTLTLNVVNASLQPVSSAQIHIVNTGTTPPSLAIDFTTFTNTSGMASFIGATTTGAYQVTVTKPGYSSAQTYSVTAQNTNPNPGHLVVSPNQTTTGTFAIDLVSSISVTTYSLTTGTWTDSFSDGSKVSPASTNIEVSGNRARFAGNQPWTAPAQLLSTTITPAALSRWGTFSWNDTQPSETTITYRVYYPEGGGRALVPDSALPGNAAGFTTGTSVDLKSIPAGVYTSLILAADLVALNPSAPSPSIEDWSLTYDGGSTVAAPFTLRGAKTIGTGPAGAVYKYDASHTTNASGVLTVANLEWDSYTLSVAPVTGYDIASACSPQPVVLAPNSTAAIGIYFAPDTTNNLLVDVKSSTGSLVSGATVRLTKGGSYDTTKISDACGQTFFSGLTNGNYSLTVSAPGYQTFNSSGVDVTGTTNHSVTLQQ